MAEHFFALSIADRSDALDVAATKSGRPAHLLEKDIHVVWALDVLFKSRLGEHLVFKGGTSLSKAYRAIDRFSEDVDLTYDIRAIAPDLVDGTIDALPATNSQADKWTKAIRGRLRTWTHQDVRLVFAEALPALGGRASLSVDEDIVNIAYAPLAAGTGYVSPIVRLEFGARSTGEPWEVHQVTCDAAAYVPEVRFPRATPKVMKAERTFWEKATSVHVYCVGGPFRNMERFSRHWYDLARLDRAGYAVKAIADRALALQVAHHKQRFFREKDPAGNVIDYTTAVQGEIKLVPVNDHYAQLAEDYSRMADDGLLPEPIESFDQLVGECRAIQEIANGWSTP